MEVPYDANRQALNTLMLAELAEGKGRFIDQLLNGAYMSCEMNSWVLSAHLPRQSSKRSLPDFREQIIDLGLRRLRSFDGVGTLFLPQAIR